jgi:hypothetical protein
MAFKIIINQITADLKGASKQELVFQNPMWDYENMVSTYGLPFSLPFSPTNDRIFSNARSEFSEAMALTYTCEQYLNDDLIAEGLIQLIDTNGAYNCNFTTNIRDIFTPLSGTVRYDGYLRDILPAGPDVSTFALRNAMTTWNGIVCYPVIFNSEFYAANPPVGWDNFVNSFNGTTVTYQNNTFVPAISVKYALAQIASYYGITISGGFIADTGFDQLVLFHNSAEDGATTAQLKLAVGDLRISEFINQLRNTFGLTGDINLLSKIITLDFSKKYFDNEIAEDWSGRCGPLKSKNSSPYQGIELDYTIDNDDKEYLLSTIFGKYTTSTQGNKVIKSNLQPVRATTDTVFPSIMSQKGRTSTNAQGTSTIKPRIAFYRGMVASVPPNKPQISFGNNAGTYRLRNFGSTNPRNIAFASEEAFWQSTFLATFQINMRKLNLSSFDIKSKVHINGWNYLIKRIVMDCQNPENSLLEAYRA